MVFLHKILENEYGEEEDEEEEYQRINQKMIELEGNYE